MTKERGILMTAPNVLNILAGLKLQTRRIVKPQPESRENKSIPGSYGTFFHGWNLDHRGSKPSQYWKYCPQGKPGDQLWVREAWCAGWVECALELTGKPSLMKPAETSIYYRACEMPQTSWKWRPSIFMCRWMSRISLEITSVRLERLNDISEEDAKAEGCYPGGWTPSYADPDNIGCAPSWSATDTFSELWESINGLGSWDLNPWVWVIEFKKLAINDSK